MNCLVRYEVTVDRKVCVGTGACYTIDPAHYKPDDQGKSTVVGGATNESTSTRVFDDDGMTGAAEGAKACPVGAPAVKQL